MTRRGATADELEDQALDAADSELAARLRREAAAGRADEVDAALDRVELAVRTVGGRELERLLERVCTLAAAGRARLERAQAFAARAALRRARGE